MTRPDLPRLQAALTAVADDPADAFPGWADRRLERLVLDHGARLRRDQRGDRHLDCAGVTAFTSGGSIRLLLNWRTAAGRVLAHQGVPA